MKKQKKASFQKRFERAVERFPGEDPLFPMFMHSAERYVTGVIGQTEIDQKIHPIFEKHGLSKALLQTWVNQWHKIPEKTKDKFVPKELKDLKPAYELNTMVFTQVMERLKVDTPRIKSRVRPNEPTPNRFLEQVRSVRIDSIDPKDMDFHPITYSGQLFNIKGHGFKIIPQQQVVNFFTMADAPQFLLSVYPTEATETQLNVIAPLETELAPGNYLVNVTVKEVGSSEKVPVAILRSLAAPAVITHIDPPEQRPGKTITIKGSGFLNTPRIFWQSAAPGLQKGIIDYFDAILKDSTKLTLELPSHLGATPGKYLIAVAGDKQQISNWVPFTVQPFKYAMEFAQLECVDESNPEWWGDDEIVVQWIISNESHTWVHQSEQYNGMFDRQIRTFSTPDRNLVSPDNPNADISKLLTLAVSVYEWDAGDAESWSKALDMAADICMNFDMVGAIVGAILKLAAKIVSMFGGDPDHLGTKSRFWTPEMLFDITNNNERQFISKFEFKNDDDTGSYNIHYQITRFES